MTRNREKDLKKYSRSELLELLIEQGRRIEQLEAELDCACRALAECGSGADQRGTDEAGSVLPEQMRVQARGNARTLLFDVITLMRTLDGTEDSREEENNTDRL